MDEPGLPIARSHATARVPTAHPDDRAGEVRAALAGSDFECADDLAVLEEGRLAGILPIERLLAAAEDDRVSDIMDADPPVVTPGVDQESVAWEMIRRGE